MDGSVMGDLVLKGATSGQITVTPTAIAGTNTLTLPAKTGNIITSADSGTVTGTMLAASTVAQSNLASNVAGNGPAFYAYANATQSVTNTTSTKVVLQAENFDTNNNFDSSTNYRFTPTVAGYYNIIGLVIVEITSNNYGLYCSIYKNGSANIVGPNGMSATGLYARAGVNGLIYMNGSTDYIELYVYGYFAGNFSILANNAYLQGFLARAA